MKAAADDRRTPAMAYVVLPLVGYTHDARFMSAGGVGFDERCLNAAKAKAKALESERKA
jgi:hypothetical protein